MVLDTLVQYAFQHPEAVVYLGYALAIIGSTDRARNRVPLIPNLYFTGLLALLVSGFYFFAVPTPATGLQRLTSAVTNAVLIGFVIFLFKKLIDFKP